MPTSASTRYSVRKLEPAAPAPDAVTDNVPMVEGTYSRGELLGQVTASKKFTAYDNAASDGSQTARVIMMYDCAVDSSGNVTLGAATGGGEFGETLPLAPVYTAGPFRSEELVGLDSAGVADLGRLVTGDTTSGLLHVQ